MGSIDIEAEILNARAMFIADGDEGVADKVKSNIGFFDTVTETASEIADTYRGTTRNRRLSEFGLKRFHGERLSPEEDYEETDLLIEEAQFNDRVDADKRGLSEQAFHDLLGSMVNLGLGIVENPTAPLAGTGAGAAAGSVLPGAGTIAGATTGFGLGVSLAILKDTYNQSIGESYRDLLGSLKGSDQASEDRRKRIAQGVGLLTGASMFLPFAWIVKKLPYFKKLASPKFIMGQAKSNPLMMRALEAFGNIGELGAVESVQEALQQITSIMGQELGKNWDGNDTQFIDALLKTGERYSEIAYAAGLGFVGGAALGGAGAGVAKGVGALRSKVAPPADVPPSQLDAPQADVPPIPGLPTLPVDHTDLPPPDVPKVHQVVQKMKASYAFKDYIDTLTAEIKDLGDIPGKAWLEKKFESIGVKHITLKTADFNAFFKNKTSPESLQFLQNVVRVESENVYYLNIPEALDYAQKNPLFTEFITQGFSFPSMDEMRRFNKNMKVKMAQTEGKPKLEPVPTFKNLEEIHQEKFLRKALNPRIYTKEQTSTSDAELTFHLDKMIEKKMGKGLESIPQDVRLESLGQVEDLQIDNPFIDQDVWAAYDAASNATDPVTKFEKFLAFKQAFLSEITSLRDASFLINEIKKFSKVKKRFGDQRFNTILHTLMEVSMVSVDPQFISEGFNETLQSNSVSKYMNQFFTQEATESLTSGEGDVRPLSYYEDYINKKLLPPLRDLGLHIDDMRLEKTPASHHDLVNTLKKLTRLAREFKKVRVPRSKLKQIAGEAIAVRVSDVGKAALEESKKHPDFDEKKLVFRRDVKASENPFRYLLGLMYNRMGLLRKLDKDVNGSFYQTQLEARINGVGPFEGRGGFVAFQKDKIKNQKILNRAIKKYQKGYHSLGMRTVTQYTKDLLKDNVHLRHGNLVKKDILILLMNMGNSGNRRRVTNFGITIDEAWTIINRELGPRDFDFVRDFVWSFYKENLPRLQRVFLETDGGDLRLVKGDYYPIILRQALEQAYDKDGSIGSREPDVRSPHTKDRVYDDDYHILDLDNFLQPMEDLLYDINMRIPLKESQVLLADKNFQDGIIGVLGVNDFIQIRDSVKHLTRQLNVSNINYYRDAFNFVENSIHALERAKLLGQVMLSPTAILMAGKTLNSVGLQIGYFNAARYGAPVFFSLLDSDTRKYLISNAKGLDSSYGLMSEGVDEWTNEMASEPRRLGNLTGYMFRGYDVQMLRLYDAVTKTGLKNTFEIVDNGMKVWSIETAYVSFLSGKAPGFPMKVLESMSSESVEKQAKVYAASITQHATYRGGVGDRSPVQSHSYLKFISRYWNEARSGLLSDLHFFRRAKTQTRNIKAGFKEKDYEKVANNFGSFMSLGAAFTTFMYTSTLFEEALYSVFTDYEPEEKNVFVRAFKNMIPNRLSNAIVLRDFIWALKTGRSTIPVVEALNSVYKTASLPSKYFPDYLYNVQNGLGLVEALPKITQKEWESLFVTIGALIGGRPFPVSAFKKFGVLKEKLEAGDFTGLSADKAATLAFISDQLRDGGGSEAYNAFLIESAYRVLNTPSFHGDPVMPDRLLDDDPMGPTGLNKPQPRADDNYFRAMTERFTPETGNVAFVLEEASLNYDDREPFVSDFADEIKETRSTGPIHGWYLPESELTEWNPPSQAEIDDLSDKMGVKRDPSMGELLASKLDVYSDTGSPEDKELKEAFREIIASPKNISPKSIYDDVAGVSNLNFDIYDLRRKHLSNSDSIEDLYRKELVFNKEYPGGFDFMDRMFHVVGNAGDLTDSYPQILSHAYKAIVKGGRNHVKMVGEFLGVKDLREDTAYRLYNKRDMLLTQLTNPTVFKNLEDAFGFSSTLKDKIQVQAGAFNLNETRRRAYFSTPHGQRNQFLQAEDRLAHAFTKSGVESVLRQFTGNRHLEDTSYISFLNDKSRGLPSSTYSDNVLDGIKGNTKLSDIEDSLRQSSIPLTRHSVILSKMLGVKTLRENPDLLSDKTLTLSDNLLPLLRPLLSNNSVRKYLDVNGFTNQGLKKLALRYARG